jgi:hypothetical protein
MSPKYRTHPSQPDSSPAQHGTRLTCWKPLRLPENDLWTSWQSDAPTPAEAICLPLVGYVEFPFPPTLPLLSPTSLLYELSASKNAIIWDVMPCGSVRTDVSEEHIASIIRVKRGDDAFSETSLRTTVTWHKVLESIYHCYRHESVPVSSVLRHS